jgi:hypothetical protein
MAQRVVDALEMVDVQQRHAQHAVLAAAVAGARRRPLRLPMRRRERLQPAFAGEQRVHALARLAPVDQTGQLVVRRQHAYALQRVGQLGAPALQPAAQPAHAHRERRYRGHHDAGKQQVHAFDSRVVVQRIGDGLEDGYRGEQRKAHCRQRAGAAHVQRESAEDQRQQHDQDDGAARRSGDRIRPRQREHRPAGLWQRQRAVPGVGQREVQAAAHDREEEKRAAQAEGRQPPRRGLVDQPQQHLHVLHARKRQVQAQREQALRHAHALPGVVAQQEVGELRCQCHAAPG